MLNQFLHTAPFVRIAFPLLLGSTIGLYLSRDLLFIPGLIICIILVLIIGLRRKWKYPNYQVAFGSFSFIFLVLTGSILSAISLARLERSVDSIPSTEIVHAKLLESLKEGSKSYSAKAEVVAFFDGKDYHQGNGFKFMLYANKFNGLDSLHFGDEFIFRSRLLPFSHTINPYQFDYAEYLKRKGIGGFCFVNELDILPRQNFDFSISSLFSQLQLKGVKAFESLGLSKTKWSIASALILGYRSELDTQTKAEFADAGVIHILAVSGLHVGIIYIVLLWIFSFLLKDNKKVIRFLLLVICIWFYAGLTGFSPSVLRAATMFSFIAFGSIRGNKGNTYNMLAASIILLLLVNPLIIREVGFQLSYLAVIGIVFLFEKIRPIYGSKWWIIQKSWELLVVSFAAQLATAPLSIYYFGQFPNLFFISNLFVIPLATASLYTGLLFLLFGQVPILGLVIGLIFKLVLTVLSSIVHFCSELPGAVTENISLEIHEVFLLYGLIVAIIILVLRPSVRRTLLFIGLAFTLSLSISVKHVIASLKKELYVLEGKSCNLVVLRNGKQAYVIPLGAGISGNQEANSYYFKDLIRRELINDVKWVGEPIHLSKDLIKVGQSIAFDNIVLGLNTINDSLIATGLHHLIILDKNHESIGQVKRNPEIDYYIIDRSLSRHHYVKLVKDLPNSRSWSLNENGAFVLNLINYSEINS